MHVVFDYQIFSLQQYGGVSRYFLELAYNLSNVDPNLATTIVAPFHVNLLLEEGARSGKVDVVGRRLPSFPGKHHFLPMMNRIASGSVLGKRKPDIIHETYYTDTPVSASCPRILTVFDVIHERYYDQFAGVDRQIPQLKAQAIDRADHIITISASTRDDIIELFNIPPEKVSVVHLASSLKMQQIKNRDTRRRNPYILYVGLRNGVKNFHKLLEVYAGSEFLHENYDLLCVGGGKFSEDENKVKLQAGLAQKVLQVDADDWLLATLYANASVFVYPSLYEGFGIPILEAMQCGCPVVCSDTSSMPEIAGDAALYFDPQDQDEMRFALESVLNSAELTEQLRQKGYAQAGNFSWEKCAAQTAAIYRQYA